MQGLTPKLAVCTLGLPGLRLRCENGGLIPSPMPSAEAATHSSIHGYGHEFRMNSQAVKHAGQPLTNSIQHLTLSPLPKRRYPHGRRSM